MSFSKPPECAGCALERLGSGFSHAEGLGTSSLACVAEALGEHEERDGLPLRPYAPAGSVFQRAVTRAGLDRRDLALYNVVQCRPPANRLEGMDYQWAAIEHCRVHRIAFFERFDPRAVLAMGGVAMQTLTSYSGRGQDKESVTQVRGIPVQGRGDAIGRWVVPTYHPSFLRRGSGKDAAQGAVGEGKVGDGGMALMGVFIADLLRAREIAREGHEIAPVRYQLHPGVDDLIAFKRRCEASQHQLALSYDIENPIVSQMDEGERDADTSTEITSIQFSLAEGEGMFVPWMPLYLPLIREILALGNVKLGFNNWNHDDPRLRANGVRFGGQRLDMMWAWHHAQPDLPMGLQFVASLHGADLAWKHLAETEPERYGCCDVDMVHRIYARLRPRMEQKGLWDCYARRVVGVAPVLARMGERGLPIDGPSLIRYGAELEQQEGVVTGELVARYPPDARTLYPKKGYAKPPVEDKGAPKSAGEGCELVSFQSAEPDGVWSGRWAWAKPFSPHAAGQLLEYMRFQNHPIPKNFKTGKDTTSEDEIRRLARSTKDDFYLKVLEARKLRKMRTTFVQAWLPGADGRVHPTFYFAPATGQLSSKNPSAVIIPKHGPGAKEFRRTIRPLEGRVLVEFDYKSFHALTLGFEAGCPGYMRAAQLDLHSLVSGEILKLHKAADILGKPDAEAREYLEWYKSDPARKFHRDKKAKPAILGIGFGLGARKLFMMNRDSFGSEREAKGVQDVVRALFPEVFRYQEAQRTLAQRQCYLISRWGFIRWFWEVQRYDPRRGMMVPGDDSEAAIAFCPANDAFGIVREAMLQLAAEGLDDRFPLVDTIHDSLVMESAASEVEECVRLVQPVMEQRWPQLVHPVSAPNGLACGVDVSVGRSLGELADLAKWRAGSMTEREQTKGEATYGR